MTLPTTISAVTYAGNGITTQFDWTFPIPSGALAVYRTEDNVAVLVDPSAYSVSGLDDPNGGTVTFAEAPALGQTITIKRNVALTQDMALVTGSAFYAEVVEGAFDHATMQIQQLAEEMGRAVQVPIGSGLDPADYLDAAARSAAAASAAASSAAGSAGAAATAQSGSETARNEAVAAAATVALPLPVESGGTGATTQEEALANLGVGAELASISAAVSGLETTVDAAIDDLTAIAMAAGFTARVVLTSSKSWVVPTKKTYRITCIGGGENGVAGYSPFNGRGGRAGAVTIGYVSLEAGAVVVCTVGGPNGTTKFGPHLSAAGGAGSYGGTGTLGTGGTNGTGYGGGGGSCATESQTYNGLGNDGGTNGASPNPGTGGAGAIIIEY